MDKPTTPPPDGPAATSEQPPDQPGRKRPRWLVPAACGLAGLLVGAGTVGAVWALSSGQEKESAPGRTFTLKGTFTLTGSHVTLADGVCSGTRGYRDITEGAAVTVYDAAGKVVATGNLGEGTSSTETYACKFGLTVPGVPEGSAFYQVEVSHRGKLTVSAQEARSGGFAASLG